MTSGRPIPNCPRMKPSTIRKILLQPPAENKDTAVRERPVRLHGHAGLADLDPVARRFLSFLSKGSTHNLFAWLAKASQRDLELVADLPPTTFSEFPALSGPLCREQGAGPCAGPGGRGPDPRAEFTALGQYVNRYGNRVIPTRLLHFLLAVYELRLRNKHRLALGDVVALIRSAGAASDTAMAKRFWHDSEASGYAPWRRTDTYMEFIKARFLTEPLYTQFDPARFRVRPLNLHKMQTVFSGFEFRRLDTLRWNIELDALHRFGQNTHEPYYAEHLTRIMRRVAPIKKFFTSVALRKHEHDERLLCAAISGAGTGAEPCARSSTCWPSTGRSRSS